jgi:hypothetical protein
MKSLHTKIAIAGILGLLLLSTISCEKFLENENKQVLTDETQWASEGNADIFLNDCYYELVNKWNIMMTLDYFTDDYNISHYYTASNWRQGICQAPATSVTDVWEGTNGPTDNYSWADFYVKLRKVNTFIQQLTINKNNYSEDYYNQRIDEARFLRAYMYSEIFVHIGGLPIITEPLDRNSMSEEELKVPRGTFEQTYDFITGELGAIVTNGYLPLKYELSSPDAGRATLGAALALKGWMELFAASPLFNTATPYLPDPGKFVHFGNTDQNRWAIAAATNKKFIDEYGDGHPYDLFSDLPNLWRASNEYNSEIIWDRQIVANINEVMSSSYEVYGGPTYVLGAYRTWGCYNPTQELVDQFCMANGKLISDPTSGYNPQDPYVNREKRFYDFIIYDGAPYKQSWMAATDIIYTRIDAVNPSLNEIDLSGASDVGDSGYYQKKMLNTDAEPGDYLSGENFVYYRYAEVLLAYAEAQNEAAGPDPSVYDAVNKVRARSDVPNLPLGLTKEEMRDAIRRERRVELCFESKRFLDTKRWASTEAVMGTPRHNMVIRNSVPSNNSGIWVYSVEEEVKYVAKFNLRQYMSPIPLDVIDQNDKVTQNPGY